VKLYACPRKRRREMTCTSYVVYPKPCCKMTCSSEPAFYAAG
jgi:hypothetical protein